ncbi:MAG: hypothetical protein FJ088_15700, partial [Deltaproteobacteria bacterium]|nr:hypothetical protein [Deltaproteobacteria bacterium]
MFLSNGILFVFILMAPSSGGYSPDTESKRADIPAMFKWDLSRLFASKDLWSKEKENLEKSLDEASKCRGELGKGAKQLLNCLTLVYGLKQRLERLYTFASQEFSTDRE